MTRGDTQTDENGVVHARNLAAPSYFQSNPSSSQPPISSVVESEQPAGSLAAPSFLRRAYNLLDPKRASTLSGWTPDAGEIQPPGARTNPARR
jgi:hypothetical protein